VFVTISKGSGANWEAVPDRPRFPLTRLGPCCYRLITSLWSRWEGLDFLLVASLKHINYTGRSEFDLEHKREKPYVIKVAEDEHARAQSVTQ
jgi:hypothetical protein